jgi:hypothetical protein
VHIQPLVINILSLILITVNSSKFCVYGEAMRSVNLTCLADGVDDDMAVLDV